MKRGDLITISLTGDYGKPRPALIIQSDLFIDDLSSITVLPITSHIMDTPIFRINIEPSNLNNLTKLSQIMIDKVQTLPKIKTGKVFGKINDSLLITVNRSLALFLGFA